MFALGQLGPEEGPLPSPAGKPVWSECVQRRVLEMDTGIHTHTHPQGFVTAQVTLLSFKTVVEIKA